MVKTLRKGPERSKIKSKQLVPTEEQESLALASWARLMVETNQEPRLKLLRCGFEGLRLPMGLRCKVKRQSISRGFPDWFLACTSFSSMAFEDLCYKYAGLFIELKRRKGGVVSTEQRTMHALLLEQGYLVCVCKGADEAIETIKQYLGMEV